MHLNCAPNFRDLGGIRTADRRQVKPGQVFRSEAVLCPGDRDEQVLAECGIRLVFDLRSAAERAERANEYWHRRGAEVLSLEIGADMRARGSHWELLREDASPANVLALMLRNYRALPGVALPALRVLFERLATGAPPSLIHCTAGKDRTGFVAAMLLHALGVPKDLILEDYLRAAACVSENVLAQVREGLAEAAGRPVEERSVALIAGVRPDYLDAALLQLERKYGGIDAYLEGGAGLDEERRRRMRNHLLSTQD